MQKIKKYQKQLLLGMFFMIIMSLACYILYQPMSQLLSDPQALKQQLNTYPIVSELIYSLVMALQVLFVFLPGEIVEVMAGFLYGPWIGMLVCLLGAGIGSALIYVLVGKWGKKFIHVFIKEDQLSKVAFLNNQDKLPIIIFIIFFIPGTPKDLITYFIPLTSMKLSTFLGVSSLARIPSVISSTMIGNALGIQEYTFSIIVFAITGVASLIGLYIYKNYICRKREIKSLENL